MCVILIGQVLNLPGRVKTRKSLCKILWKDHQTKKLNVLENWLRHLQCIFLWQSYNQTLIFIQLIQGLLPLEILIDLNWNSFWRQYIEKLLQSLNLFCKIKMSTSNTQLKKSFLPATLVMFITLPFLLFNRGNIFFVMSMVPHKFTFITFRISSVDCHSIGPGLNMPALFIKQHSPIWNRQIVDVLIVLQLCPARSALNKIEQHFTI